ncbi:hypothetical protein [Pseudanabaena sp. Chao 1811]|uniref:hypothetical protein n=1 Tax=Pseudanabaena sp. Chao 1811 TaxID=2963092 RepID=UPI0022F3FE71|nr:hypothetical protein [Pseudanabaena sp. Chao 1811]
MAQIIEVERQQDLSAAIDAMGLQETRPVLVVIGGASLISDEDFARLQKLFVEVLAPLVNNLGCFVVDGGTDAGVMKLMGDAKRQTGFGFPLIGVSPIGLVQLPDTTNPPLKSVPLEPHHTHFFLVAGFNWGDESPWLAKIASLLAGDYPSVTVLINGGEIALVDAKESTKVDRPIVAIAGSGRLADEIANAALHPDMERREEIGLLLEQGQIHLFDLDAPIAELEKVLRQKLSGE